MSEIVVRLARPADREAMLRITRDVWEGHDYVPHVWHRWLAGTEGIVQVAELDRQVVGLQHIALQPSGASWFEGIRVDSQARGRGVAAAMLEGGLDWSRSVGATVARMAVSDGNTASIHLSARAGFETVGRYGSSDAAPLQPPNTPGLICLAHPFDLEPIRSFIAGTRYYTENWTAYELDDRRLALLLATRAVVVTASRDAVAIATQRVGGSTRLSVGLLEGEPSGIRALATALRIRAGEVGLSGVGANLPVESPAQEILPSAGFELRGWGVMLLRELRLGTAPHPVAQRVVRGVEC
ncbi:MAG: GNAT family N-acetyltransferase [Chloroflexota bacterium]